MTAVIFLHITGRIIAGLEGAAFDAVNALLSFAYAGVPLFFMISGYLLLSSSDTSDLVFMLKRRIPRLVIPLAFWTAVYSAWIAFLNHDYSASGFFGRIFASVNGPVYTHLWFMYTLIAIYLTAPFIRKALESFDRKGHIIVLCLIALINLRQILNILLPDEYFKYIDFDFVKQLSFFSGNLSVFVLGYYLGNMKKKPGALPLALITAAATLIITLGTNNFFAATGSYMSPYHEYGYGFEVILASALFLLFRSCLDRDTKSGFLKEVSALSYGIYFMHALVVELAYGLGFATSGCLDSILLTLAVAAVCYLLLKTASSLKPFSYIFTGLSFDKACSACNWQHTFAAKRKEED